MALIFWNKNTLSDQALLWFKDSNAKITLKNYDEYTLIKSNEEIVGINIKNASSFLNLKEGAHNIEEETIKKINDTFGLNVSNSYTDSKFVIGQIIKREVHPKSKKLFVLKVQADRELQIVTNTLNSIEGECIVVAKVGSILPSGTIIKPTKVMGIKSEGMLCSESTLCIGDASGAYLLKNCEIGKNFKV